MFQRLYRRIRFGAVRSAVQWPLQQFARGRFNMIRSRADAPVGHGVIRFVSTMSPRGPRLKPVRERDLTDDRSAPRGVVVPVLLVDGEPVAAGVGSGMIAAPAGRHVVQVQAAASGRYTVVDVPEGGAVRLTSKVRPAGYSLDPATRMSRFLGCFVLRAPRRESAFDTWESVGNEVSWRVVDPDRAAAGEPEGDGALLRIEVVYVHDCELPPLRAVPWSKAAPPPPGAQHPAGNREAGSGSPFKEALGEQLESFGRSARTEWNWLLRNWGVDAERRRRRAEARDDYRTALPWIATPRVRLGDLALPAVWGRNEYRLPAGSYDLLEIAVPPPPEGADSNTKTTLRGESRLQYELELEPRSTTTIEAYARIRTEIRDDDHGPASYTGRIWTVRPPWSDS